MTKTACLKNHSVYVESEFAPLKRAILSQSECIVAQGNDSEADDRDLFSLLMKRERENLKALLESYGVEVLLPGKLSEEEKKTADICLSADVRMGLWATENPAH